MAMTELRLADRMSRLGTETAFDVLAKVNKLKAEGKDVVSFGLGEPDFDTPEHVKQVGMDAIARNETHYGPSQGLPALRNAIVGYMKRTRGLDVTPEQIVVSPGAKPILFSAMMALVNPGEDVVYPSPGYPIYESVADWIGAKTVPAPLLEERSWRYDPAELARLVTPKTRLIVLNSPQNPTGGCLSADDMAAIAEIAIKNDCWVLSDEVYSQIVFDGEFASILQQPGMAERSVVIDGFSKTWAMTGWRMGFGVAREDLITQLARIETNLHSCTATFTQLAGVAAIEGSQEQANMMAGRFKARGKMIAELLNGIEGVKCQEPGGAFYVMANVTAACKNLGLEGAGELCDKLLYEAGVALLPRTCFGRKLPGETDEYVRLSFATSEENIQEGVRRMKSFIEK